MLKKVYISQKMQFFYTFNFTFIIISTKLILIYKKVQYITHRNTKEIKTMHLCYSISNSVTQKEWERVYKKTLFLADKLNLANWDKFYYKGIYSHAYCKVKEQTEKESDKVSHFWVACGEYDYNVDVKKFSLQKEINLYKYNENAGPAILGELDSFANITYRNFTKHIDTRYYECHRGTYFVRLLAILCFM